MDLVAAGRWRLQRKKSAGMGEALAGEEAPVVSANMNNGKVEMVRSNSLVVAHEDKLWMDLLASTPDTYYGQQEQ